MQEITAMPTNSPVVVGLELGGTKCIAILGSGPDDVQDEVRVPTTTRTETLAALEAVLDQWSGFAAIGIASFGPVSVDRAAADWGSITTTPKPGWANAPVAPRLAARYRLPVGFHTDVVGAALGEGTYGAAMGLADYAYMTVGTGIGVGLVAGGVPVAGMTHPELGHLRPLRVKGDDWPGICPFHGACVEGLASGPAIAARTGTPAPDLPADDPAWELVAHAIAQACATVVLTGVPRRIVIGGGVMVGTPHLLPRVRRMLHDSLAGYLVTSDLAELDSYVVPPRLGGRAGPLGALVLAHSALTG